jgi:hypothetical protein
MRSTLVKALQKKFEKELEKQFPQFEEDKESIVPPKYKVYVWKSQQNLYFFICLLPSPKDDSFTVDIGWSKSGKLPNNPVIYESGEDQIVSSENIMFRLSRIYERKQFEHWWYLAKKSTLNDDFFTFVETPIEESMEKISPKIDEVFKKVKEHVIPYFEKVKILLTKVA